MKLSGIELGEQTELVLRAAGGAGGGRALEGVSTARHVPIPDTPSPTSTLWAKLICKNSVISLPGLQEAVLFPIIKE